MNAKNLIPILLAAFSLAATNPNPAMAQTSQRIQLSQLETMFSDMRAKAPWNVDGPLLWGYFFFDPSQEKLQSAAKELEGAKYRVVGISEVPGRRTFRLHVEKVEVHSPASLHARNGDLYELAAKYKLASYDGMDVGPAPK
jgi:Regulator of ribonuclease activity B